MIKYILLKVEDNLKILMLFKENRKYYWNSNNEDYKKLVMFDTRKECENFIDTHKDKIGEIDWSLIREIEIF